MRAPSARIAAPTPRPAEQSIPRTVTAGRAHSMSETGRADQSTPSSTRVSLRNRSAGYATPYQASVSSSPRIVVSPSARRAARRASRPARAARPEPGRRTSPSALVVSAVHPHHGVDDAFAARGRGGQPTPKLPVSHDEDRVRAQEIGVLRDERLEAAGALLLRALGDQLRLTGLSSPRARERGECVDDVPLAVGGAAAEPASVALGQLERRRTPRGVVERRLYVVVA